MISIRTLNFLIILTIFPSIHSEQKLSNQLFHILTSLKPIRSEICQFKFENCIQDSSYADQLDTYCNIYSRLRDCFRPLLDDPQCSSSQLNYQYRKSRQNEYEACAPASSHTSIRSSSYTSSSLKLKITCLRTCILFFLTISFSLI